MKKRETKPVILTQLGVMKCSVAEFDPAKYQGLKKNCGRRPSSRAVQAELIAAMTHEHTKGEL